MERLEILENVKDIIVDKLGVDKECVCEASDIKEDLGADSLDTVELIMEAEKEFSISIEDEDAEKVKTVEDVVNLIEKLL